MRTDGCNALRAFGVDGPGTACLMIALLACLGCRDSQEKRATLRETEESSMQTLLYHACRLQAGDLREDGHSEAAGEEEMVVLLSRQPYHLRQLIHGGERAAPILLLLLRDQTETEIRYIGSTLSLWGGLHSSRDSIEHTAKLSDLADFGLRCIYDKDVGYRSYETLEEREAAIQRWRAIIFAADEQPE